jgi:hypothetical protein
MKYLAKINNEETVNTNSFNAMVAFCRSFIEDGTAEKIVIEFDQDGVACTTGAAGDNIGHHFSELIRTQRMGR